MPFVCTPWYITNKKLAEAMGIDVNNDTQARPRATFQWSWPGIGFGEFCFYVRRGKIYCDNEMMSKEDIKKLLCQMVDTCELTEPASKKRKSRRK